jgi:hypothetical protein
MDKSQYFTISDYEAHRNLLRIPEEPAGSAYLGRLPTYRLVKLICRYRVNCIIIPILSLIYLRAEYRRTAGRRNYRSMVRLSDMLQYSPNGFPFSYESDNLHFAAAAWTNQRIDFENSGKQHRPD